MTEIESSDRAAASESVDSLAERARRGEEEAFALLAKRFAAVIRHTVSSLPVVEEEKADLAQEALLGLFKAVMLFDPARSSFSTFAKLCIRSSVSDGLRKYLRRTQGQELFSEDQPEPVADATNDPERIVLGKESLLQVKSDLFKVLSKSEKTILCRHLAGNSVDEIAQRLGKDRKSIHNALYRIRRKLSEIDFSFR